MSGLLDLPNELLLAVANNLRRGYRDLKSLTLSCSKFCPISQEVLHVEVTIRRATSLRGPSNVTYLARTLIQRPDLALKVRKLHLGIIGNPIMHSSSCLHLMHVEEQGCTCGLKKLLSLCTKALHTTSTNNGLSLYNFDWVANIHDGFQLAIVGLILCITPNLESLVLNYHKQKLNHLGFYTTPVGFEHISFDDLFGNATAFAGFPIEHIKGFTKLTRLSTNTFPPSKMLWLPQLKVLELGLLDNHCDQVPNYIRPSFNPTNTTLTTALTHLAVRLDKLALYSDKVIWMEGMYGHLRNTIKSLTALVHLSLRFESGWGNGFNHNLGDLGEASYEYVASALQSLSLTHLVLDIEAVSYTHL